MTKRVLVLGLTEKMGGVETFIYNTTRFSNKDKYEYDFLVHGTTNPVFKDEINEFYADGRSHFFFVPSFKTKPVETIKVLNEFYKNNGNKYDYVHLETGATSEIVYVIPFCFKYNFKVITHSHNGNGYSPIVNSIFRPILNYVSYKKLSCSSEATQWLFGKKSENVQIINNGIDVSRFTFNKKKRDSIRKRYNVADNVVVIGHIGRFSEQKNHMFLLDIFNDIQKKKSSTILMLVGVGELFNDIKNRADKLGIADKVVFCGLQYNTEDFYSAFDVFVMPSLYEGLPIVGVEAQCEGLPCFFSSNISKEIELTSNVNILKLDNGASYWSKKIIWFLNDNETKQNREKAFINIEKNNFSISTTVHKLEEVYGD